MSKFSAGLLPYRIDESGTLQVMIVHPGGPFWSKKDLRSWSIAKGEYTDGDDPMAAAEREFSEELGQSAPPGERLELNEIRQPSGKRIQAWAVPAPTLDVTEVSSNTFEMEWPPKLGRQQSFPEIDKASWFPISTARKKLLEGQIGFLDRLVEVLVSAGQKFSETGAEEGQTTLF